jgi:predicted GH43/DUF377 family glycosyl hydrolase
MNGGKLIPLLLDSEDTNGTAIFNPSIFVDTDNGVKAVIRHCQYTFYHSELKKFPHDYGPLLYLNPEDDISLTTTNYLARIGSDGIESYRKIDTSSFDRKPLWEFIGLEDARLFRWNDKLYICGVRRDTTTHGEGRMELSEIDEKTGKELSRWRIPAPGKNDTYCEKNWMPILDMPFHFVKWCNPLEIVKIDPENGTCETVLTKERPLLHNYRGGSQVIRIGEHYVCLTHTVRLWLTESKRKDAVYLHAFLVWDKDWNLVHVTDEFSFMNARVEFACGMAKHNDRILISFGYQDNCAFVLDSSEEFILDFIRNHSL